MSGESTFDKHIRTLKKEFGLLAEKSVLREALGGLDEGVRWVMTNYDLDEYPHINIGDNTGSLENINGYAITDTGEKIIGLHIK